jgi:ADP-heptose:LPS heptosyltransferase
MARGGARVGPPFHREGSRLFYSSTATSGGPGRHAVEQCLDIVGHLGLKAGPAVFPVTFPDVPLAEPRPRVAVLPVSRWPAKNWPEDMFAESMRILRRRRQVSFYLLGAEEDAALCRRLAAAAGEGIVVNCAGRQSLVETGAMLKQMDLLISNDSGPVHMAAAVGTPTLVLFGPTDPCRTGPYGEGHRIITSRVDCRPCFSRICRRRSGECLKAIEPEEVVEEALGILATSGNSARADGSESV